MRVDPAPAAKPVAAGANYLIRLLSTFALPELDRVGARFEDNRNGRVCGSRQKPAFAQPVNDNGRRVAIPEGCEISQNSQIAPMQTALHPRAH
jgi:hypothetical protein